MAAPRPPRLGPGPGEHDITTSIRESNPGAGSVGQSATASPEASEQISLTTPSSGEGAADNPAETRNA